MSTTSKNIVVPGPTEGVIRSAQMTDKISPENSAQLGVNVNFDRIGAFITRLGVATYSPGLPTHSITSLGFLLHENGDHWLLAQSGTDLEAWPGSGSFASIHTLSTTTKCRYAQFLGVIYIVNGNATGGGTVCGIYDGSAYSNTSSQYLGYINPGWPGAAGLPAGDYIQAGFDGRVWIADAATDTLYYSNVITADVSPSITTGTRAGTICEFINNFSPQDGETITGLHRVPQALLLFKQNHIFRVYSGGLSAAYDKYPAFNVGTFSQESVVEGKDALYFHHSSGFYRFNYNSYNSQPTEISRRIRDFVQAIPRAYYESIVGSYDGFDAIKWFIGPCTVEGVTYSNCCVRFSIATQVWTVYDYPTMGLNTASINFDDGDVISSLVGTSAGKIGMLDTGNLDFDKAIYFEEIDRWRSFTEMWSHSKDITGMAAFSIGGAGSLFQYQTDADLASDWHNVGDGKYKSKYASLFPTVEVKDFNKIRFRTAGFTSGPQIVFEGYEIMTLQDKGYDEN